MTLSVEEVLREARALREQGFRNVLLVAGEHPKFVSPQYLADCVRALRTEMPGISQSEDRANENGGGLSPDR